MGIGDVGTRASLMVQPRLGMVGELGRNVRYHRKRVVACVSRTKAEPRPAPAVFEPSARRGRFSPMRHAAQRAHLSARPQGMSPNGGAWPELVFDFWFRDNEKGFPLCSSQLSPVTTGRLGHGD